MSKNILITGCAGLFGSNFSRYLLDIGYNVVGIDNFFGGYPEFLPKHDNFKFYQLNLESDDLSEVFKEDFDCVFHFAAYAAEGLSPFIRKFNYTNNVISSSNIINWCIQKNIKIIFTSSMAVYGNQTSPFSEEMEPKPIDPYGIAKYTVEQDLKSAADQFDLKYNIVRPHNVLGLYQNIWDRYRNVIGIFIRKIINNEPILIYGDGQQTRAFSDIKYYMQPLERLIYNNHNETFNIGAEKYFTINEIGNICLGVGSKYGFKSSIEYAEERHEVKHAFCRHDKAISSLKFEDHTDIESLIDEMFLWAMSQPNRPVKNMSYEITNKIYEFWK
jgi:UDP-glucose 4-epimerase